MFISSSQMPFLLHFRCSRWLHHFKPILFHVPHKQKVFLDLFNSFFSSMFSNIVVIIVYLRLLMSLFRYFDVVFDVRSRYLQFLLPDLLQLNNKSGATSDPNFTLSKNRWAVPSQQPTRMYNKLLLTNCLFCLSAIHIAIVWALHVYGIHRVYECTRAAGVVLFVQMLPDVCCAKIFFFDMKNDNSNLIQCSVSLLPYVSMQYLAKLLNSAW